MLQSVHRLSLNYYKYNSLVKNLYKSTTSSNNIGNCIQQQIIQPCRYFSSKTDIESSILNDRDKQAQEYLDTIAEGNIYKEDFHNQIKKEIFKKTQTKPDRFQVHSPIPNPESDEQLLGSMYSFDDIVNQQFQENQVDSNQENLIETLKAAGSRFKPFKPIASSFSPTPPVNGVSSGYSKRKSSRSVVQLKKGSGEIQVNGRSLLDYFPSIIYKDNILQPLVISETIVDWDINIRTFGGGLKGQSEATARALAIALCNMDKSYFPALKMGGLLKHDYRTVERKKPGQPKARKKYPLVKR